MFTTLCRTFTRALTLIGALLLGATLITVAAPTADASAAATATTATVVPMGTRVVSIAASRSGSPYVYGGSGPRRFDCSGLTMWTFNRLGKHLPHSAARQYWQVRHIRSVNRRPGDLVFFYGRGGVYHVAIYAGRNQIWHAPYPGAAVRRERLWTTAVYYGRVR